MSSKQIDATQAADESAQPVLEKARALLTQQPALIAIVLMALAGIGISIYLTAEHYAKVPLYCSTTGLIDCANVLKSPYSVVPGTQIPITIPGMLWFLVGGGLAVTGLIWAVREIPESPRLSQIQLAWSALGLLFVLYLVYAEIVQVHNICEWCTGVHVLTLLTFLVALGRFQRIQTEGPSSELAAARSARARTSRAGTSTARATATTAAATRSAASAKPRPSSAARTHAQPRSKRR